MRLELEILFSKFNILDIETPIDIVVYAFKVHFMELTFLIENTFGTL